MKNLYRTFFGVIALAALVSCGSADQTENKIEELTLEQKEELNKKIEQVDAQMEKVENAEAELDSAIDDLLNDSETEK